jgi:phosphate transport system substrate-binding protein
VIAGSGVNLPLMRKLSATYETSRLPGKIVIPDSIGSAGAIKAALDGAIDLGLTSRPLQEREKAAGLKQIQYARSAVAFAAHPSVPVDSISVADLLAIYSGAKRQWPDGQTIAPQLMYKGDSVNAILVSQIKGFSSAINEAWHNKYWQVHYNDFSMAEAIAKLEGSIGFTDSSFVYLAQGKMKLLQLEGVAPTADNILRGAYHLEREMYFIYRDPLEPSAIAFLDYVFSPEGRRIIQAAQAIPVARLANGNR